MRSKSSKLMAILLLVALLSLVGNDRLSYSVSGSRMVKAASPPAQQGGSQLPGPELNAAEVVNLFWHKAASGARTLNKESVGRSELGLSTADAQDPKKVALAFVQTQRSALGLVASEAVTWKPLRVRSEKGGVAHVALQQLYNELPVFASQIVVHTKDTLGVTAANGEYRPLLIYPQNRAGRLKPLTRWRSTNLPWRIWRSPAMSYWFSIRRFLA